MPASILKLRRTRGSKEVIRPSVWDDADHDGLLVNKLS